MAWDLPRSEVEDPSTQLEDTMKPSLTITKHTKSGILRYPLSLIAMELLAYGAYAAMEVPEPLLVGLLICLVSTSVCTALVFVITALDRPNLLRDEVTETREYGGEWQSSSTN